MAMCTPFSEFPAWDPRRPYQEEFLERIKKPACADPLWSPMTDEAVMNETIAAMRRLNMHGVLSGTPERVKQWRAAAPGLFWPGLGFDLGRGYSPERLRAMHKAGDLAVLAEITTQYEGVAPDDPRLEPVWALAEELDLPVGIHVGPGPFGVIYMGGPAYRARMHSALSMEECAGDTPELASIDARRLSADRRSAGLCSTPIPQVHVEVGVIVFTQPRAPSTGSSSASSRPVRQRIVRIGPDGVARRARAQRKLIEEAPFLTEKQKREHILNNAARSCG